jgi:hypothetical protein
VTMENTPAPTASPAALALTGGPLTSAGYAVLSHRRGAHTA